jgi:hypothetical protein
MKRVPLACALALFVTAAFTCSAALAAKPASKPAIKTTIEVVPVVASKDEQMSGQLSSSKPICIKKAVITIEKNGVQVQQVESKGNGKWGPASVVGETFPAAGDMYRIEVTAPGGHAAYKCKLRNFKTFVLPAADVPWAPLERGLALPLPAAAPRALPKTGNTLIVPGKSIGGVALGGSAASVTKAWGPNKTCEYQCLYEGSAGPTESAATASALLEAGAKGDKVWEVFIDVGENNTGTNPTPNFNTPLTKFKTAEGIGLGSKLSELKRAYHGLEKQVVIPGLTLYTIKGKKKIATIFTVGATNKITGVNVESHPGG